MPQIFVGKAYDATSPFMKLIRHSRPIPTRMYSLLSFLPQFKTLFSRHVPIFSFYFRMYVKTNKPVAVYAISSIQCHLIPRELEEDCVDPTEEISLKSDILDTLIYRTIRNM